LTEAVKSLSYANVASTLALVVALSGGAYAVTQLPSKSVGTKELKNQAVTSKKVRNGSLKPKDLKPGSVLAPGSGVSIGPTSLKSCAENILLTRTIVPKAPARLLGIGTGYWYANQMNPALVYTVDASLQVRSNGAIVGGTAKTNSQSSVDQRASLGTSGVLLDPVSGAPTVLRPGQTYVLEMLARTGPENCVNQPLVGAAELSYVILANHS
jgi:hypothetical protein